MFTSPMFSNEVNAYSVFADFPDQGNLAPLIEVDDISDSGGLIELSCDSDLREHEVTFFQLTQSESGQRHSRVRWFFNGTEVPLCGHGALALAYHLARSKRVIDKISAGSNSLDVAVCDGEPFLAFPQVKRMQSFVPGHFDIGTPYTDCVDYGRDLLFALPTAEAVHAFTPDESVLAQLPNIGVLLTALDGDTPVFRFFAPRVGLLEDMASGSVIPQLHHYWSAKNKLSGVYTQLSREGIYMTSFEQNQVLYVGGPVYPVRGEE